MLTSSGVEENTNFFLLERREPYVALPAGWRRQSVYASDDHYVFASETMRGKQPYWPDNLMKRHIQPVAKAIGPSQEDRMAHFPALLRHAAEGKWRGCQNRSGALATREQSDHAGCLRKGCELEQAAAQSKVVKDVSDVGQKAEEKYPQIQQ
jgi:hypothetical protein